MGAAEQGCLLCCLLYVQAEAEGPFRPEWLAQALGGVAVAECVVRCGREGAAIAFLGHPADALHAALALRDDGERPPGWRMGLNLGPVQLIRDMEGQVDIAGDGLELAQLLASFAAPGGIVVSRAYYEVAVRLSTECGRLLQDLPVAGAGDGPVATGRRSGRTRAWSTAPRQFFFAAALVAATLAGLIYALWAGRDEAFFVRAPASGTATATQRVSPEAAPRQTVMTPAVPAPLAPPRSDLRIVLAVAPWGEVYVDGEKRGITPPLKRFVLPPGAHVIQIRNGDFPPYTARIEDASGGEIRIKHKF